MTAPQALSAPESAQELVEQAHDAMGVRAIERALEGVATMRQSVMARSGSGPAELAQTIVAELLGGTPATVEIADRLTDAVTTADRDDAVLGYLGSITATLSSTADVTRRAELDTGLAVLRARLARVIEEARPAVAALGEATTVEQAVQDDGGARAWREVSRLAVEHDAVRIAQRHLVTDGSERLDYASRLVDTFGHVEQAERHGDIAAYVEWRIDRVRVTHPLTGHAVDPPALPWLAGTSESRLMFACHPEVSPWVPTWQEMQNAQTDARASRVQDTSDASPVLVQHQDTTPGYVGRQMSRRSAM